MTAELSTPPNTLEILAITFVVDSSLAVAAEWSRIIVDYVSPMLKRLNEANPNAKPRMAFVTYGCADTLPTPILCKRFFIEPAPVTKEMKESPSALGIGLTNSGAGRGMAALEGIVAAIELFDQLQKYLPLPRPPTNHIFHITGAPPDDSPHPQYNELPSLDDIKWNDIPDELKKRNINFSVINIAQNLPQYSEIHSATTSANSPKEPWFTIRPSHIVLLAGFPVSAQKAPKRVGDAHPVEKSPEAKRPRLTGQSTERSPKTVPTPRTPSTQSKPSPILPSKIQTQPTTIPPAPVVEPTPPISAPSVQPVAPPHQPPAQVPPPQLPQPQPQPPSQPTGPPGQPNIQNMPNIQTVFNNIKSMEGDLRQMQIAMQSAQNQGNQILYETIKVEFNKKNLTFQKGKQLLAHLHARLQAQQNNGNNGNSAQNLVATSQIPRQSSPIKPEPTPSGGMLGPSAIGHQRTSSQSSAIMNNPMGGAPGPSQSPVMSRLAGANPALTAQMQKIIEQRQRLQQQGGGNSGMPQGMNMMGGMQSSPNMGTMEAKPLLGSSPMQLPQQPEQQQQLLHMPVPMIPHGMPQAHAPQQTVVWHGSLCWSGTGAVGKKEMVAHVMATTSNVHVSCAETWPKTMTLVPLRDSAVASNELQAWITQHKPVLCGINAQTNVPDQKGNEFAYRTLCSLLMQRNIYAAAAWILPSGEHKNNVIFFPFKDGLVGAFFPITGVPDTPKSGSQLAQQAQHPLPQPPAQPQPNPQQQQRFTLQQQLAQLGMNMPQEFLLRLQAMPLEQRQAIILNLRKQLMMKQHQAAAGAGGGGMSMGGGANNPAILNAVMAMNSLQQQQAAQQQQAQHQQSQHVDLAFGGNVPNFGGQFNFMNAMGGMGQQQPGQPNMMGAGMSMQMNAAMRMAAMNGQFDPKMMQSFGGGGMPG